MKPEARSQKSGVRSQLSVVSILVPIMLMLFISPGCDVYSPLNATEQSRLLTAQKTYTATLRSLTLLAKEDKLSDSDTHRIDLLVDQIDGYLKEWEHAVNTAQHRPELGNMVINLIADLGKYQLQE